jgi:hypothetical protein
VLVPFHCMTAQYPLAVDADHHDEGEDDNGDDDDEDVDSLTLSPPHLLEHSPHSLTHPPTSQLPP